MSPMSQEQPKGPSPEEIEATEKFLEIDPASPSEEFVRAWETIDTFNKTKGYKEGDPIDGAPQGFEEVMLHMGLDVREARRQGQ